MALFAKGSASSWNWAWEAKSCDVEDGEIKAARRSPSKPLTGLVFLRAGRSGRVPRGSILSTIPMLLSAL